MKRRLWPAQMWASLVKSLIAQDTLLRDPLGLGIKHFSFERAEHREAQSKKQGRPWGMKCALHTA